MFLTIGLSDFDFFAAKMEIVVFGIADGPTAGMIVKIRQHGEA